MLRCFFINFLSISSDRREYGLERFVPTSLVEAMKRKELRKLLSHFVKVNQQLTAPGQKQLTALQAKLHYLKIIAELPSYGAKCFSTNFKVVNKQFINAFLFISFIFNIMTVGCQCGDCDIGQPQVRH